MEQALSLIHNNSSTLRTSRRNKKWHTLKHSGQCKKLLISESALMFHGGARKHEPKKKVLNAMCCLWSLKWIAVITVLRKKCIPGDCKDDAGTYALYLFIFFLLQII